MRIGLIDVDSRKSRGKVFPNLALMKLASWHRARGDSVEFCFPLMCYDRVYASKVFTHTPDIDYAPVTDDFRKGGTGYQYPSGGDPLPDCVEHSMPDYSLYGIRDTAYGFLTRGCPRGCPFCIVSEKEGRASRKVADLSEFWSGQRNIVLLDPNLTACRERGDLLDQLARSGALVTFSQGLDIRLVDDGIVRALNRLRIREMHFAWDDPEQDLTPHFRRYAALARHKPHGDFGTVLCLTNFGSTIEQDLHRVYTLRDLGYSPYVMVYDKQNAPREARDLQRWCNNRFIFKSCKRFEDYNNRQLKETR